MPISRKKACTQCRRAKAGCSLGLPQCSRCVERNLTCDYHDRPSPYGARPSSELLLRRSQQQYFSPDEGPNPLREPSDLHDSMPTMQETVDTEPRHESATEPSNLLNFDPIFTLPSGLDIFAGLDSEMQSDGTPSFPSIFSVTQPSTPAPNSNALLSRRSLAPQALFTAKILLGQLESYPKMMIEGKRLPPFIHSQCSLSDGLADPCSEAQNHQCLAEPLAICASLVHMFYSRTTANRRFLWKTIYDEQTRLKREIKDKGIEAALEATQAMCIYLLLQAFDKESLYKNDITSMVACLEDFITPWYYDPSYEVDLQDVSSPQSRQIWVLKESSRRTLSVLYMIETVLDVVIGNRDITHCRGSGSLPLPCIRGLWELKSTYEWAQKYREVLKRKKMTRALAIKDLLAFTMSSNMDEMPQEEIGAISDWCENIDDFGLVIWTAATMPSGTSARPAS